MGRLRQQHPGNYPSSSNISSEFENFIRYVNSAEKGNKTLSELLSILFNDSGEFDGPIEMRLDTTEGLQYRVGEYSTETAGWETLATIASLRGASGQSVGTIEGPFLFNRQDYVATSLQTEFNYTFDDSTETVIVFVNGLLTAETEYTADADAGTVTFDTGLTVSDLVSIYSVRTQSVSNYNRTDYVSAASQAVYAFVHTADDILMVWLNGVLQREGGAYDYTTSPASNTVTFTSANSESDLVTVLTAENLAIQNVAGMMFEAEYTDGNGYIDFTKLAIDNDEIPQAKVASLVSGLAAKAKLTVAGTTPSAPAAGDLWLDTSISPNILKFYDGTQFLQTSPDSTLPSFLTSNASQYVRVNGTGTALEYGSIDFSALVPKTYMGAANGVASLDSGAKLPSAQLPEIYSTQSASIFNTSTVSNGDIFVMRVWKQVIRIDGIATKLSAGTCTVQIKVDGVAVGITYAVSSSQTDTTLATVIEIDGTTASKLVEIEVTSVSSAADLEVALAMATVSV
jgi:hypothetical protein